jgi:hypothetical protein
MPHAKSKITDSDLNDLFFGLVKLIKKTAEDEISEKLKSECEFANSTLRSTIIALNEKEKQLNNLSQINKDLVQKLMEVNEKLNQYRSGSYALKTELEHLKNKKKANFEMFNNLKQ